MRIETDAKIERRIENIPARKKNSSTVRFTKRL